MKKKKKEYFNNLIQSYSEKFIAPPCEHFAKCGGCLFQQIPYDLQLELKKNYVNDKLKNICSVESVFSSEPFHYRNRMDYVTAFGKVGLRESGNHRFVVDIEDCALLQKESNEIFKTLRDSIKEIDGYNYLSHKGYLRYTILRQAWFTKETMINFVIADKEIKLHPVLDQAIELADSVSIIFNDGLADTSFGEIIDNHKNPHIEEIFDGIKFQITPNSFFQSNSSIAKKMYSRIKEEVNGNVLDLYSGVGSISLYISEAAETVLGIEEIEESVSNAHKNKEINEIENVDFQCADARVFMRENDTVFDTIVMDPPRSGIHPKLIKDINRRETPKIVYMSCNVETLAIDLEALDSYKLISIEAYDMFPQTPHIELLAVLEKK